MAKITVGLPGLHRAAVNRMKPGILIAFLAVLAGGLLLSAGLSGISWSGADPRMLASAGIAIITLGLWITGAVPEFLTSLLFLLLSALAAVAPPETVFSGFHTSAMWMIFGGLVIGHAVSQSGLGDRVVTRLVAISPPGYLGVLATVALAGLVLSFVIPTAIGRVVLLAPIAVRLAGQFGLEAGTRGQTGLVLTAGMSTSLPAFTILPSNVPNLVMSASAENLYGVSFTYGQYLLANFPVLGGMCLLATVGLNWWFFREELRPAERQEDATGMTAVQQRLSCLMALTVFLWITDTWHGLAPAWVAMGAALFCALPRAGVIPASDIPQKINFAPLFFVGGVVGFGAVASETSLSTWVGSHLVSLLAYADLSSDASVYAMLVFIGSLVAVCTTVPTAPGVMTPLADQLAEATGWPVVSVLMAQVPTWVLVPFPYLVPPIMLTLSVGKVPSRHAAQALLCYFSIGVLICAPLHFLWAGWLGVFP
ncbi:MAG: SLC13 family permease [Leisingera sp.]